MNSNNPLLASWMSSMMNGGQSREVVDPYATSQDWLSAMPMGNSPSVTGINTQIYTPPSGGGGSGGGGY